MDINEDKAENTPAGGVLMGKKDGQTIIHDKGTMSGYLVGKLHKDGGIKAVNKATGQPLEMQGGEVIITAPAVSDQTKREFEGKMMTNREILSAINEKGGGVSFANGGDIPAKINTTDCEYKLGGKVVKDTDIAHSLGMNSTLKKGKQHFTSGDTTYDIDAIYNAIKKGKLRLKTKEVETFPMKYPVYDKKYSETVKTDFRKPNGITVRTESGEEVLIDGNHRMNNAYLKGRKTMKTYYIEDSNQIAKFTKKNKFELGGENKVGGHLSSGKSLKQIAEMHNVSLADINEELSKGLEVEKEHFADFKERTRVAKDHLVENPNYYTILEKAGLKNGGHILSNHRNNDNLVKDAKSGNTPARDLNNYNDVMDLEADGMVGMESGLAYADGGITPIDANIEGDSVDIVESDFAKGGVIYDTTKPKLEKVTIKESKYGRESIVGRNASNAKELQDIIIDYVRNSTDEVDWIKFYVNDATRGSYYIDLNKGKKNTVKNVNTETVNAQNIKRVIDAKDYLVKNYDWTDFFELASQTSASTDNYIKKIQVAYESKTKYPPNGTSNQVNTLELYGFLRGLSNGNYKNIKLQPIGKNNYGYGFLPLDITTNSWNNILFIMPEEMAIKEINRILYGLYPQLNFDDFVKANSNSNTSTLASTLSGSKELDLTDTKVWIGDDTKLSEEIQKAVFSLGWQWDVGKIVIYTSDAIYFDNAKRMVYKVGRNAFDKSPNKELNPQEILLAKKPTITVTSTNQYPEYYEYMDDTRNNFTKGKIYKVRNPKDIEAGENFIDDNGIENGFSGNNAKYFKASTEEAFLAQQSGASASAKSFDFTDTKINVKNNPTLSQKVQKIAFENGWEWENGIGKTIDYNTYNYLYFTKKSIFEGMTTSIFINSPKREITESEIFGSQSNASSQTQYPEYYEFVDKNDSFTKGKIYKIKNPKDLKAISNFVDDSGSENGFGINNEKYFKPSTEERFLSQQNYDKISKFNVVVEKNSSYPDIEVNNVLELFSALQTRVDWDSTILLKYKTPKRGSKKFGFYFRNNPNEYYELKRENGKVGFDVNYLSDKVKQWFPNEVSDKFFKNALTSANSSRQLKELRNTKIWIGNNPELSEKIQKRAFELGWGWFGTEKTIKYLSGDSIYFDNLQGMSYAEVGKYFFNNEKNTEITEADILGNQVANLAPFEATQVMLEWKNNLGILVYRNFFTKDFVKYGLSFSNEKSGQEFIDELKNIEKESDGKDVEIIIKAYAQDNDGNEVERISEINIGKYLFQPTKRTNEEIKSIVENDWIDGITFDKFFEEVIPLVGSQTVNLPTLSKEDLQDTKIWIGDNVELRDKVIDKLIEIGIPIDATVGNKNFFLNLYIFTYNRDFAVWTGTKKEFENSSFKEIFPIDLGIDLCASQELAIKCKPIDLSQTKIWTGGVKDISKQIQERAFELGWSWKNYFDPRSPHFSYESALYFETNKDISYGDDRQLFDSNTDFREITFKDLFEKIEPSSISQTPTINGSSGSVQEITDLKEAIGVLEGIASQASQKYNTNKYDENLELLKEVKEEYELTLSFTPESSFMYERIELMKKITEVQKEITRITELKNGGAFYILSKIIERLDKGEDWKQLGNGEIMVNEVPEQEIDAVIYTEKFKNWFGDWEKSLITKEYDYVSKVLTERGKPCVMYHGAKRIKYSYRQVSNGVLYLAENRSYAEWFSSTDSPYQKQGDYLTQCFVNVKNPIDLTPFGVEEVDLRDIIQYIDTLYPLAKIYDVLPPNTSMAIMNNQLIGRNFRAWYIIRQFPEFNKHIRDNTTYDGFIYYENNPSDMILSESGEMVENITKATAVFNSNQVKLVDAMLFDDSLDDWRFEKGGKVN